MTDTTKYILDTAIKILAAAIAAFGIWKFFFEKNAAERSAQKSQSIAYIEEYGAPDLMAARRVLFDYWEKQDRFIAFASKNPVTEREYSNFVRLSLQDYANKEQVVSALFSMANFFDRLVYCREAQICDKSILDNYFCPIASREHKVYEPFYGVLREEIGSPEFGAGMTIFSGRCGPAHLS